MKFVALLMISAVAADKEPAVAKTGDTCADAKAFKCAEADCCGTVSDLDKATVKANEAAKFKGFAATVCMEKPKEADTKKDDKGVAGVGSSVVVVDAVAEKAKDDAAGTPKVDEVKEVKGTFLCNAAADADAGAASYMTVGAAAIIAAATLLQ